MAGPQAVTVRAAEQIRAVTPPADQRTLAPGQTLRQFAQGLNLPPDQLPYAIRALKSRNPHVRGVDAPASTTTIISVPSRLRPAGTTGPSGSILAPPTGPGADPQAAAREAADRFVGTDPARVRELQALVGTTQDGVFGADTQRRLAALTGSGEVTAEGMSRLWARRAPLTRGPDPRTLPANDASAAWRAEFGNRASVRPEALSGWNRTFADRLISEGLGPGADQRSQRERLAEFQRTHNITMPRGATPGDLTAETVAQLRAARATRVASGERLPATRFDDQVRAFMATERPRLEAMGMPPRVVDAIQRRLTAMMFQESGGGAPHYDTHVNRAGATGPLQVITIAAHDLAERRHGTLPSGESFQSYIHRTYGLGNGAGYTPPRGGRTRTDPGNNPGWDSTALLERQRGDIRPGENGVSPHIAAAGLTYINFLRQSARTLRGGYQSPEFWGRVDRLYSGAAHDYNRKVNRFERLLTMGGYFD